MYISLAKFGSEICGRKEVHQNGFLNLFWWVQIFGLDFLGSIFFLGPVLVIRYVISIIFFSQIQWHF